MSSEMESTGTTWKNCYQLGIRADVGYQILITIAITSACQSMKYFRSTKSLFNCCVWNYVSKGLELVVSQGDTTVLMVNQVVFVFMCFLKIGVKSAHVLS